MCRSRLDLIENAERFIRIDLDLSDFEKERTQEEWYGHRGTVCLHLWTSLIAWLPRIPEIDSAINVDAQFLASVFRSITYLEDNFRLIVLFSQDLPTLEGWKAELTRWLVTYREVYSPTDGHPWSKYRTNPAAHNRESNSQPVDHKSDALTTTAPGPRHYILLCRCIETKTLLCHILV